MSGSNDVRLAVFEFGSGGHFPNYLRLLFERWRDTQPGGRLHAVVTNQLLQEHAAIFDGVGPSIEWSTISQCDEDIINETRHLILAHADLAAVPDLGATTRGATFMWSLVQDHGARLSPRHILLNNIDNFVLPLSAGLLAPSDFSGILFRPIYQYPEAWAGSLPAIGRSKSLVRRLFVDRLFQHPQLRVTFFIDQSAVESLEGQTRTELCYLPDPVRLPKRHPGPDEVAAIRRSLGISDGRLVLLLFGDIAERKGVLQVLDAMARLDRDDAARTCLAIVGRSPPGLERLMAARCTELRSRLPIEIVRCSDYITDSEIDDWFFTADLVMATYLLQLSMSGVLVLAAAHGRPILSQDFGLMGRLTRANGLGGTCNPENPDAMTQTIGAFLKTGTLPGWNADQALAFGQLHSHDQFAATIFSKINRFIA